jgi:hypothetical protein
MKVFSHKLSALSEEKRPPPGCGRPAAATNERDAVPVSTTDKIALGGNEFSWEGEWKW